MPTAVAGKEYVERRLIGIVADVLGCDASAVLPEASFESLGIDSISVIMLTVEIEKAFGVKLPMTIFYQCKCIDDFLEWIVAEQTP